MAVALGALLIAAAAPPSAGPMLLIGDRDAAIRTATNHGARLLGAGPGGATLVWADSRVFAPLAAAGVLPLAAPFGACGSGPA